MSAAAITRANGLHKFFKNPKAAAGSAWEEKLIEHARRVSEPLATKMLAQMGLDSQTSTPFKLLENAGGVGVVAPVLQQIIKPEVMKQSKVICGDFSDELVALAKKRMESEGWVNTEAIKVDAQVRRPPYPPPSSLAW